MMPGDLIMLTGASLTSKYVCLWSFTERGGNVAERMALGSVLLVLTVLPFDYRDQLLVVSPQQRIGYVMSDAVRLVDT